jgi:hypothetical protein
MGFTRVGCFPCIMCRHGEIKLLIKHFPDRIDYLKKIENDLGRSFFPPNYIPPWAQSGFDQKSGKKFPTINDVVKYIDDGNQLELFEAPSCMSIYNICE